MSTCAGATVVVPCFNERERLQPWAFRPLGEQGLIVLFVDDGSTDGTADFLAGAICDFPWADILSLRRNVGKGEAVRAGMNRALERGAEAVGYLDADLATPVPEMLRLFDALDSSENLMVAIGSRVSLLGSNIERSRSRHIQGRLFATLASIGLNLPVYDTQCGAKAFRDGAALRRALSSPFTSRWAFDVELIGRLLHGDCPIVADQIVEVPLHAWCDVGGSRMSFRAKYSTLVDLVRISLQLRTERRSRGTVRSVG